jgi:hypothetical protein
LPAVQGREHHLLGAGKDRKLQKVGMEVQDVEGVRQAPDVVEHHGMIGQVAAHVALAAQRSCAARHKLGGGLRIGAGEQRDLVTLADQLLGEIGHDPFRATVEARRHAFDEGRYLGNFHEKVVRLVQWRNHHRTPFVPWVETARNAGFGPRLCQA